MRILITGGAGFIGSHLDDALIARGHQLTVVDNLVLGRKENVGHLVGNPNFRFIEADLLNMPKMCEIFAEGKFDMVYRIPTEKGLNHAPQVGHRTDSPVRRVFEE